MTTDPQPNRGTTLAPGRTRPGPRTRVQTVALVVGIAFLAVGVLGFVPGITTN